MNNARLSRRRFLAGLAATGAATSAAALPRAAALEAAGREASKSEEGMVFKHSVASGDPTPNAVILWTRVTPTPDATPGSGLGEPTTVAWEVSTSPGFETLAASGTTLTDAGRDHTVKVDARGLTPATTYHYRFRVLDGPAAGALSRTGRTRTTPSPSAMPAQLRFAVCSCSNFEAGFFNAYRDIASRDDLEFLLHLGDFTYEYASGEYGGPFGAIARAVLPAHRTATIKDYRIRQGHYHEDPDLAAVLAAKPLVAMWDDHEFADNTWREGATGNSILPGDDFAAMKPAGRQAYLEWMPVRVGVGEGEPIYRSLAYGQLAEIILPDLRSYRDAQVSPASGLPESVRAAAAADRSMMGTSQFDWFANAMSASSARWQIVGNEVMFAPLTLPAALDPQVHDWLVRQVGLPADGIVLNADQWDGYMAERQRIIDLIASHGMGGVVFLGGDIHSSWAADIPHSAADYRLGRNPRAVATEFVSPSVTAASGFDALSKVPSLVDALRQLITESEKLLRGMAPWHKYIDLSQHGYLAIDVTDDRVQADWHHGDVSVPAAPLGTSASYQAIHGSPGAIPAPAPLERSLRSL